MMLIFSAIDHHYESAYSLALPLGRRRTIMEISSTLHALGEELSDGPAVILRLRLMVADEATGEPRLVTSFVRRTSMPPILANLDVGIALELQGQRRVLKPTLVTWDETRRVCVVEVEWLVSDASVALETEETASCPA
ncbi:MAG: hypothetical protein ABIT71_03465 [Vicinamibacteraceae bacterium]